MSLTLHAVTGGIRDGRHQNYPTPGIDARPVLTTDAAEEVAARMLRAYHSISYLSLTDQAGGEVRTYRRCDFFYTDSSLREVHHRVANADIAARLAARK
jgi:hypothetical protein